MQEVLAEAQQDQSLDYLRDKEEGAYKEVDVEDHPWQCSHPTCHLKRVWGQKFCQAHWEEELDFQEDD